MTPYIKSQPIIRPISGTSIVETLKGLGLMRKDLPLMVELLQLFDFDAYHPPYQMDYALYLSMLEHVRQTRYHTMPPNKAYEYMGRSTVSAYFDGPAGSVIKVLMPIVSDKAAVDIILKRFRETLPFGQHTVTVEKPGCILYRKQGVNGPHDFMCGMILAMLDVVHAKAPRVTYRDLGILDVQYRIEWGK